MSNYDNETERKEYIKELAMKNRNDALAWAKDKSDAQILDTLVEQRDILDDIKREAEEKSVPHNAWDTALADELLRRMAESGVKSFRIDDIGLATLMPRRVFSIDDPQKVFDHIVATKSIALFGSSLKKAEVEAYEKDHGTLPDGITSHTTNSIRITRTK